MRRAVKGPRCSGRVYRSGGISSGSACQKPGTIAEDGQHWCKHHAPSLVRERRAKQAEASTQRVNAVMHQHHVNETKQRLTQGVIEAARQWKKSRMDYNVSEEQTSFDLRRDTMALDIAITALEYFEQKQQPQA